MVPGIDGFRSKVARVRRQANIALNQIPHTQQRSWRMPGARERPQAGTGVPKTSPSHHLGSPRSVCSLDLWPSRKQGPELSRLPEFLVWLLVKGRQVTLANACILRPWGLHV